VTIQGDIVVANSCQERTQRLIFQACNRARSIIEQTDAEDVRSRPHGIGIPAVTDADEDSSSSSSQTRTRRRRVAAARRKPLSPSLRKVCPDTRDELRP